MAGIDKLYFDSPKEALEFYLWAEMFDDYCVKATQKSLIDCFYMRHWWLTDKELKGFWPGGRPVINTPECIDKWLWNHCPLDFVRKKMEDWWDYSDEDLNNPEFYIERSFDRDQWRKEKTVKSLEKEIEEQNKWLNSDFPHFYEKKSVKYANKVLNYIKSGKNYYSIVKPEDWLSYCIY